MRRAVRYAFRIVHGRCRREAWPTGVCQARRSREDRIDFGVTVMTEELSMETPLVAPYFRPSCLRPLVPGRRSFPLGGLSLAGVLSQKLSLGRRCQNRSTIPTA